MTDKHLIQLLESKINEISNKVRKENIWVDVQNRIKGSVVQLFSYKRQFNFLEPYKKTNVGLSSGTGFFIDDEGHLLSNYHVVEQSIQQFIRIPIFGKERISVTIVGVAPERDVALLKVSNDGYERIIKEYKRIPYLKFGNSDKVVRTQRVIAVGFPLGQDKLKITLGVCSGKQRLEVFSYIQIDTAINPGNSGGPAIDSNGNVIGINSKGIMNAENIGYIIPINEVKDLISDLKRHKLIRRPSLGVIFIKPTKMLINYLKNPKSGGLYITKLFKNSILFSNGIKEGDMLYNINGYRVDMYGELNVPWSEDKITIFELLNRYKIGVEIPLIIYRRGEKLKKSFKFIQQLEPIRYIYPEFEPTEIKYLPFGGMILMNLKLNHIYFFNGDNIPLNLLKYSKYENQDKSVIIITKIFPRSEAINSNILKASTIITHLNDIKIKNLKEFIKTLGKSKQDGYVKLRTKDQYFTVLSLKNILINEKKLSKLYNYPQKVFDKSMHGKLNYEILL